MPAPADRVLIAVTCVDRRPEALGRRHADGAGRVDPGLLRQPWRLGTLAHESPGMGGFVAAWDGDPGVRRGIEALASASMSVLLVFEHVPRSIEAWLGDRLALGPDAVDAALVHVEQGLIEVLTDLRAAGILHLDAHVGNVRTDGETVMLTDLGLATASTFTLSARERAFTERNRDHDLAHALTRLVDWVITAVGGVADWQERDAVIERIAAGEKVRPDLPPGATAMVQRSAATATVINRFYRTLHLGDRRALFPADDVRAVTASMAWRRDVAGG